MVQLALDQNNGAAFLGSGNAVLFKFALLFLRARQLTGGSKDLALQLLFLLEKTLLLGIESLLLEALALFLLTLSFKNPLFPQFLLT